MRNATHCGKLGSQNLTDFDNWGSHSLIILFFDVNNANVSMNVKYVDFEPLGELGIDDVFFVTIGYEGDTIPLINVPTGEVMHSITFP